MIWWAVSPMPIGRTPGCLSRSGSVQKAWTWEKAGLSTVDTRGGTVLLHSFCSFSHRRYVWAMTPQSFTSAWHCCLPRNGTSHTARPYVGYGTAWAIPSFAHPSKQSEVLDPLRDMQWGHQQPSTLLSLNHTSQRMTSDLYCTSSKHYIKYKYYLNFCLFFFPPICTISCSRFITFQEKKIAGVILCWSVVTKSTIDLIQGVWLQGYLSLFCCHCDANLIWQLS